MIFKKKDSKSDSVECNHVFNDYFLMPDPKRMCIDCFLSCSICNATEKISVTKNLLDNLRRNIL